jgi:hypothetical protein
MVSFQVDDDKPHSYTFRIFSIQRKMIMPQKVSEKQNEKNISNLGAAGRPIMCMYALHQI